MGKVADRAQGARRLANAEHVQEVAKRAEARVGAVGTIAGIEKHAYAKKLVDRYQRMFGDRGLRTEVSVANRIEVPYGRPGSVRLDVLEGTAVAPVAVYDYKFGRSGLTAARLSKLRSATGHGDLQVIEVRP